MDKGRLNNAYQREFVSNMPVKLPFQYRIINNGNGVYDQMQIERNLRGLDPGLAFAPYRQEQNQISPYLGGPLDNGEEGHCSQLFGASFIGWEEMAICCWLGLFRVLFIDLVWAEKIVQQDPKLCTVYHFTASYSMREGLKFFPTILSLCHLQLC